MKKWIIFIIILAIVAIALIVYGGTGYRAVRDLFYEENKVEEVLVQEVSKNSDKLIEVYREIAKVKTEVAKIKEARSAIEKEKDSIVVPANISDLVVAFNRKGFRARARSVLSAR
jgi:hypothetical protein